MPSNFSDHIRSIRTLVDGHRFNLLVRAVILDLSVPQIDSELRLDPKEALKVLKSNGIKKDFKGAHQKSL